MMDFNDVSTPVERDLEAERAGLRAELLARLESVLFTLFPAGKKRKDKFFIGDVLGSPGESLEIVLEGEKAGLWTDRATGDGGDIFDLIAASLRRNARTDFALVLQEALHLLGSAPPKPCRKSSKEVPTDELGPATAKWDYLDANGKLLAVVYRYDPPGGKKEFRPWDAKRRRKTPPDPRPLYNQPGMLAAESVVLVEGEKCAQALIEAGICATTAMHGAKAPVDKTDWSPLKDKTVLIWPDKDKPGWEYAMAAAQAGLVAGAASCDILLPPDEKPEGWDAADALAENFEVSGFIGHGSRMSIKSAQSMPSQEASVWATDDALALSFTSRYADDWRYCAAWGKWMLWTGCRWQADETLLAHHLIRAICRESALRADSHRLAAKLAASNTVGGVERLARTDRQHASTSDEWDVDPWRLNTPAGVVDLRSSQLLSHRRNDHMTKITTASPGGDFPRWRAFLADVTGGDADLAAYLQRMVGYCLTGVTSEHALFFLYGTGANGKSVFVNVITTILGDYAANAPMDTFMESRTDRHPTDLAGLRGARFVSSIETEQGRRWNESKVKSITGGDKVSARFMRQDFFDYTPQFKLVIAGNHKPSIRNVDEAMKRRLHLIPFTVTIPPEKRDGQLTEKLLLERDGILAWAVKGGLLWQQHGLCVPEIVREATRDYFDEEDAIQEFEDAEVERDIQAQVPIGTVFTRWKNFAEARGYYAGSARWLSEQLVGRGYLRVKGTAGVKCLRGLRLRAVQDTYLPYADD